MPDRLALGERLRRARRERHLSQAQLAGDVGISQAAVSYYERGRATPADDVTRRLEQALELPAGTLSHATPAGHVDRASTPSHLEIEEHRRRMLQSLEVLPEGHAVLDFPAGPTGGDLAFAVDLHSHALFAVLDGFGSGAPAALSSLVAASAMIGPLQQAGVTWPHELVRASSLLARVLVIEEPLAEMFVALFDRRHRELSYCCSSFPPPVLRIGDKISRLRGTAEELGVAYSGRVKLGDQAMLLVATDGLAHLATKSSRTFWDTVELKAAVEHARSPRDLIRALERRAGTEYGGQGAKDDMLALAISL
ncbi:SpoIIE family protein phosphatase [Myxococcota bacterium]